MKSAVLQWIPRVALLLALATFAGCARPGSEFVGHWVNKAHAPTPSK
jgi:hypothetical protein